MWGLRTETATANYFNFHLELNAAIIRYAEAFQIFDHNWFGPRQFLGSLFSSHCEECWPSWKASWAWWLKKVRGQKVESVNEKSLIRRKVYGLLYKFAEPACAKLRHLSVFMLCDFAITSCNFTSGITCKRGLSFDHGYLLVNRPQAITWRMITWMSWHDYRFCARIQSW